MVTERGVLPVGIEFNGGLHRDFELRPRLVRDSVEAMEDPRALKNESYAGLCILSKQLVKLGDVPSEAITADLLMGMFEEDLGTLYGAAEEVARRIKSFRGQDFSPAG